MRFSEATPKMFADQIQDSSRDAMKLLKRKKMSSKIQTLIQGGGIRKRIIRKAKNNLMRMS